MEEHYPIMDKSYTELICEEIEDETVAFVKAASKVFYKAKAEMISFTIGTYMDCRFVERQNRFIKEEDLLSPKQVKDFYKKIDHKKLNLLFELLEKARVSTYDLHAKILAKLYGNLLKKSELNYHEKTLLSNIDALNDDDLIKFYELLNNFFTEKGIDIDSILMKKEKLEFEITSYTDQYIYEKLLRVGLISSSKIGTSADLLMYKEDKKDFYIHDFSKDIYLFLKEIFEEVN